MSNQLSNEFILNTNAQIALNNGITIVQQPLVHNSVNSSVNDNTSNIWQNISDSATDAIGYNLLVTDDQQVSYSTPNSTQIQEQNMSQTAQIVLLPTQNINLVANVPKQEQVQMILPNDVGYQILTSIPNVNVLVPTNLLFSNGYILIPNSQNQNLTAETTQLCETIVTSNQNQFDNSPQQLQEQECEYIALADTGTQTVLGGIPEAELSPTAHLISNNGQIVGIIGSDQLSILQCDTSPENQVLLAACIDPNENINLVSQVESSNSYDINAILASTISTLAVEKSDQNQAKQWLKDSYIVNRALKALKKTNAGSHHHSSRPHPQVRR